MVNPMVCGPEPRHYKVKYVRQQVSVPLSKRSADPLYGSAAFSTLHLRRREGHVFIAEK